MTQEIHSLRLAVLMAQKRTGEILSFIRTIGDYGNFIREHRIAADDAEMFINLHRQWEYVQAAIEWAFILGLSLPANAEEALRLLGPWKSYLN